MMRIQISLAKTRKVFSAAQHACFLQSGEKFISVNGNLARIF